MMRISGFVAVAAAALAAGLAAPSQAAQRLPAGLPASAALLLRYDADHDGIVTREEMEAGLKTDYAAADTNGDGCLGPAEVRAENQRRLTLDGAVASPLVDKTKDGRITQNELRGPSMPMAPPSAAAKRTGMDAAGSTTQTPTNPTTGLPY